ncbi:major facilitator superfamily transporter [Colletotrichum graminicola]|uniref:Major facilitator superfamily transporter n=1 Tax=Colletotrichum graminicola (strain M1.001 / M2 / FGSC 10212) TaxID=645133 RepID=E3QX06_COLGM|nr:major facilitator superfamily transporter [Colletotrichum graminicola M1.001]EFQ35394.1 major facilitator superfamily transporter [Colletotrichum graminicola M1.001]WDK14957.1 major facilitator superfamily transporter [Colletotrichum graminicola]
MANQPVVSPASQDSRDSEDVSQNDELLAPYSDMEDRPPNHSQEVPQCDDGTKAYAITDAKFILVVAALTLTSFLVMLDMSILPTAIPEITTEFHSLRDIGWFGSAYLLASSTMQPLTGKLYLGFGLKHPFLAFLGVFELGSLLCGVAPNSRLFILARAIAGLGASGLLNGALNIIAAITPMHKRPALIGFMMLIGQLGMIGGPLIGGFLTQYAGWRWCFYINLPIGAISAVILSSITIPDGFVRTAAKNTTALSVFLSLDPIGFVLFSALTVTLFMALQWGGSVYAWSNPVITGMLCASGGLFAVFSAWEKFVGENAMFPYSVLRKRVVWASCLTMFLMQGCALIYLYYLPIYFQAVRGSSPLSSGVYNSPGIGSQMLLAAISGVLVGKMGYYLPWVIASGILGLVGSGLISALRPDTSPAVWIGYQIIAGVGRGCGSIMPMVATQSALSPEQTPLGMSLVAFCQSFGGSVFLTFAQVIFSYSLVDGLKTFAPTVDIQTVIDAGAAGLRDVVRPEELAGVIEAYNLSFTREFHLAAAAYTAMIFSGWGMGWYSVKK